MTGQLGRRYTATDAVAQIARRDLCEAACAGVEGLTPGCVAELRAENERLRARIVDLERAVTDSQQYLMAWLRNTRLAIR